MANDVVLEPAELERYADAITKSIALRRGDTIVVRGAPAHREIMVAVAASAYRGGAHAVDVIVADPLVMRSRLLYGRDDALGVVTPWTQRRFRELMKPEAAEIFISGESDAGFLDGIPTKRIRTEYARVGEKLRAYRRASLDMRVRWTIAGWPTDYWAGQVYPELPLPKAKRKLARDLMWFSRLTDEDGPGASGWIEHGKALARRAAKLTRLGLTRVELRGPGTALDLRLVPGTAWLGGSERTQTGRVIAANMPTEETFTSPDAAATEGTFTCTFPLSFQGRLIDGLKGEFRSGRLVRLDAKRKEDRDFVAGYIDSDPKGNGRRLGEMALVDSTSRIGQSGRTYYDTLLDENAAAHIAFGSGFGGTRTIKPARGLNQSPVHLDVMIGSPDFEATGINAKGTRIPVIADGLWAI
ncbi:MAG TPA: aminopeptidase [Gaiellaceae bacterium]|nr:aminopeptidase [Gaiellaceae bacterium]